MWEWTGKQRLASIPVREDAHSLSAKQRAGGSDLSKRAGFPLEYQAVADSPPPAPPSEGASVRIWFASRPAGSPKTYLSMIFGFVIDSRYMGRPKGTKFQRAFSLRLEGEMWDVLRRMAVEEERPIGMMAGSSFGTPSPRGLRPTPIVRNATGKIFVDHSVVLLLSGMQS
jgi:hypothetical protein